MRNPEIRNQILYGLPKDINDDIRDQLTNSIDDVSSYFDRLKNNKASDSIFGSKDKNKSKLTNQGSGVYSDSFYYTNLANMINGDNRFVEECGSMLDAIASKNRKYYSIIKDYQIMDILIPQINRVIMFLVNECISPDVNNMHTFDIKYNSQNNKDNIGKEIDRIRDELGLDADLRTVYTNRLKLGREYRIVNDYNESYNDALELLQQARVNETAGVTLTEGFNNILAPLTDRIDDITVTLNETCFTEDNFSQDTNGNKSGPQELDITINLNEMNIEINKSPIVDDLKDARTSIMNETVMMYSKNNARDMIFNRNGCSLNEASQVIDKDRLTTIINTLKKKQLQRCMIRRPDPAKMFKLTAAGRDIGYIYTEDIDTAKSKTVNVAQALKDRLLKARVTNMNQSFSDAEDIIAKQLSEKIIKCFDPNIGINRIEDIDLLQNYFVSSGIVNGNKKITFYYKDDIFDMSRPDDSILTNAVFFTKLYSTLMMNNVLTKILRGRGRQIHTVNMGVSPMVKKYVVNAMAALTMPENNLGTLHGSFEQLLNPLNSASDIVIPSEDDSTKYIQTDYIEGQNVDMDNDFLKFLLNSIVSSFGLDPAVLDATNGNIQFAKTLTMESVQICILILNEQNTLAKAWKAYVLKCLDIEGSDALKSAISSGLVDVKFFAPKSLTLQMSVDEINNAKNYADAVADLIPIFNLDGPEIEARRNSFIYEIVKDNTNVDWAKIDKIDAEAAIASTDIEMWNKIFETIRSYKENTQNRDYDTMSKEDLEDSNMMTADNDDGSSELGDDEGYAPGADEGTPEEGGAEENTGDEELPSEDELNAGLDIDDDEF